MTAMVGVARQPKCCTGCSASILELFTSVSCSVVTTLYTLHSEGAIASASLASKQPAQAQAQAQSVHIRPSAGVMFGSCLVLGCSASSFLHRYAQDDPCHVAVFAVHVVGASFNMILLGYLPWAVCVAMVWVLCRQALAHWTKKRAGLVGEALDESTALF